MRVPNWKETAEDQLDKLSLVLRASVEMKENLYDTTAVIAQMFYLIITDLMGRHRGIFVDRHQKNITLNRFLAPGEQDFENMALQEPNHVH